jgi:hypothetical protein
MNDNISKFPSSDMDFFFIIPRAGNLGDQILI